MPGHRPQDFHPHHPPTTTQDESPMPGHRPQDFHPHHPLPKMRAPCLGTYLQTSTNHYPGSEPHACAQTSRLPPPPSTTQDGSPMSGHRPPDCHHPPTTTQNESPMPGHRHPPHHPPTTTQDESPLPGHRHPPHHPPTTTQGESPMPGHRPPESHPHQPLPRMRSPCLCTDLQTFTPTNHYPGREPHAWAQTSRLPLTPSTNHYPGREHHAWARPSRLPTPPSTNNYPG